MPEVNDYTALLSGSTWNGIEVAGPPVIVTFSFPTSLPDYVAGVDGFTADTLASFQAFTAAEQAQALLALGEWSAASGLVFIQVAPGQGDINFQNVDFDTTSGPSYAGAGGIAFYPFGNWNYFSYPSFTDDLDAAGDVFMNAQFQDVDGTVNYGTLLHEIGHALGLKHPTETVFNGAGGVTHDEVLSSDDPTRTIMASVGDGSPPGDVHLLQLDKDAVAFLYGPAGTGGVHDTSSSGANAVSDWSWNATTQTLTQTAATIDATIRGSSVADIVNGSTGDDRLFGLAGDDELNGGEGNDALFGGSGSNTLAGGLGDDSYYVANGGDTIEEDAGGGYDNVYATTSYTLPDNVEVLYLYGAGLTGAGNNQGNELYGDGLFATHLIGGTGADYMVGGAGDDTLAGGGGLDLMYGMDGADVFHFDTVADAPVGPDRVTIGDFATGIDKIQLWSIRTVGGPNDGAPLAFIGSDPFSGTAGELHQVTSGANTIVEGDVDGDGAADFQIELYGTPTLQASDFLACYRTGTGILTDLGEVPVEDLSIGDRVVTADGTSRPVKWIGRRAYTAAQVAANPQLRPVVIRRDALAAGVPHRDLHVSALHGLLLDGAFVPAAALVNGASVYRGALAGPVEYIHVELADHAAILAEGALAETFVDDGSRQMFDNAEEYYELYGAAPSSGFSGVRVEEGWALEAIRRRLADRAGLPPRAEAPRRLLGHVERLAEGVLHGWAADEGDDGAVVALEVLVDGAPVAVVPANRYRVDLDHAGIAGGRAGFTLALPQAGGRLGRVAVRRIPDGAMLGFLHARVAA